VDLGVIRMCVINLYDNISSQFYKYDKFMIFFT